MILLYSAILTFVIIAFYDLLKDMKRGRDETK